MSTIPRTDDQAIVLNDVTWDVYAQLRAAQANRHLRMTFDRGVLTIMSPSKLHERVAELLGALVRAWCEERDIPLQGCGATTFQQKSLERALEPDKCFYIEHEALVRSREELDLSIDPPPDLVVEVDVHASSRERLPLYAALGVPEVWRWRQDALAILVLEDGRYLEQSESRALAGFPMVAAIAALERRYQVDETTLVKEFRRQART